MPINYATLKTELTADPRTYGYAPNIVSGAHNILADMLNEIRVAIQIDTRQISSAKFSGLIVLTEYEALSAARRNYLDMVMSAPTVDLTTGSPTVTALTTMFGAATTTRANVVAAQKRAGSRGEELFGLNTRITADDVSMALAG